MPHIFAYKGEYFKNAQSQDKFVKPKCMVKEKSRSPEWKNRLIDWVTFYRRNIHRFIQHYFGIKLYLYQIIWIYFMSVSDYFITIASRASAKSWLIAVYACAIAVLYPNSEIVLVSATKKNAAIIVGKIANLKDEYPNLDREISHFPSSASMDDLCRFHNGSTIKVVACRDSGRGERATLTVGEEFRLMDKEKYDKIVKPFAYARVTPYGKLPEWKDLPPEEPREILISSAYHKGLWWYTETCKIIKDLAKGKNVGFIAFDYLIAIEHRIKTIKLIEREKSTMDEITFQEEYCNIPWGESADAYFKLVMFNKTQNLKKAFYPQRKDRYNEKRNPYEIKKTDGEKRIISVDVAMRAASENDNTIISCTRCFPTPDGYHRDVCYMESHMGENTFIQALRIKQLKHDFDADYIVLDLQNSGISVFDALTMVTKDYERDMEYEAYSVVDGTGIEDKVHEELVNRAIGKNGLPIIYPISASQRLNDSIAVAFRDKLQKNMFSFLINEIDADDFLIKTNKDYMKLSDEISEKAWFLHPYVQTSAFVNECISLSASFINGFVKLKEPTGGRKDRYTSVSYMNYFVSTELDPKIMKDSSENNIEDILKAVIC